MTRFKTISSTSAMIAALSMAATPVAAAELPAHVPQSPVSSAVPMDQNWEPEAEVAQRHRRHRYRHRRHRGVDAGDVVAGVLILGGIAAIASAASSNKRARRQGPYASPYRTNSNARSGANTNGAQGIDNAVDMCLREINRDVRVEGVDNVSRSGEGWNVTGRLYNGDGFSCRIGNNGKISDVSFGRQTAGYTPAQTQDRQYSNDRYAAAWDREEGRTVQATAQPTGPQPAYPGGPLPGDEGYEDGRLGG